MATVTGAAGYPRRVSVTSQAASDLLRAGRLFAPEMAAGPESFDCAFPPETPATSAVEFGVPAMRACGFTGELQWTVRDRGVLPR